MSDTAAMAWVGGRIWSEGPGLSLNLVPWVVSQRSHLPGSTAHSVLRADSDWAGGRMFWGGGVLVSHNARLSNPAHLSQRLVTCPGSNIDSLREALLGSLSSVRSES